MNLNEISEAVFLSDLQSSQRLSAADVAEAIGASVRRYGKDSLAAEVAEEYGEHPETAAARMKWAIRIATNVLPSNAAYALSAA